MLPRAVVRLLRDHADRRVLRGMAIVAALVIATSILAGLTPLLFKLIVDAVSGTEAGSTADLLQLVVLYVAAQWCGRMFVELRTFVHAAAHQRVQRRLGRGVFAHVLRLPLRYHLERGTGATGQTLANGMQGLQLVIEQLAFAVLPVVVELATVAVVLAHLDSPGLLAIFLAAVVVYAIVFWRVIASLGEPARAVSAAHIDAHDLLTDSLLNCETIKSFAAEERIRNRYGDALRRTERSWLAFFRLKAVGGAAIATTFAATLAATLGYTLQGVLAGAFTVGDLVMVGAYLLQIVRPVEGLGYALQQLSQGCAFLEKLSRLLEEPPEAAERGARTAKPHGRGELRFEHVSLTHAGGQRVLRDVSLTVAPGATIAIVGTSGAGKSSLVRLLTRLLEPDGGQILLDGVPLRALPLHELRQAIAVVPQNPVLFNDSLRYNIAFGRPDAGGADIERAAAAAQLAALVRTLPDGYDTIVGERGLRLSGGERQRVCIARVALLRPRVFVFDEATSSLDSRTEQEIVRSLHALSRGTTTLVIAHRLSTVVEADRIHVLHEGRIVESGTHSQLLAVGGHYSALWKAQHASSISAA